MGLYMAFSVVWILGIFKASYLKIALVSHVAFMLGLGFGRLLSLGIDGTPTSGFILGTIGELSLGFYGIWTINSKYFKKP